MKKLIRFAIRSYQVTISATLDWLCGPGWGCRFEPTCSHFMLEAVEIHGAARGLWLGVRRLARCGPWGGMGLDPVPPARPLGARSAKHETPL